jgi:hypothetical protein
MTPSQRTRSHDIDDAYDGLPAPELQRAPSNNPTPSPQARRLLSPHQGVRRRAEVWLSLSLFGMGDDRLLKSEPD